MSSFLAPVDANVSPNSHIQYVSRVANFNGENMDMERAEVIEIPINTRAMRNNAQTLDHFKDATAPNYVGLMHMLLQLVLHIGCTPRSTARSCYTFERVPDQNNSGQYCMYRLRLWYKDEKSDSLTKRIVDQLIQNECNIRRNHAGPSPNIDVIGAGDSGSSSSASASAPGAGGGGLGGGGGGDAGGGGGISGSSSSGGGGGGDGGGVRYRIRAPRTIPLKQLHPYQQVTRRVWKEIVEGLCLIKSKDDPDLMMQSSNAYCPTNVFSIDASLVQAFNVGAHRAYCTMTNYYRYDANKIRIGYRWPFEGRQTWMVAGVDLTPLNYKSRYFPWVSKPKARLNVERDIFLEQHKQNVLPPELIGDDAKGLSDAVRMRTSRKHRMTDREREEVYDNETNKIASDSTIMDYKKMREINEATFKAIEQQCTRDDGTIDVNLQAASMNRARIDMLRNFHEHLWTEDGNIPAAMKSIAKAWNTHLKNHSNFNMPQDKITANLSRLADTLASLAAQMEVAFSVSVVQCEVIATFLSCMQLYSGTEFHRHVLLTGPARSSKTHTFWLIHEMLIEGTVQMYSYNTAKSKTADSDMFEMMIEIYEEVVPSVLGVNRTEKGHASASANTDAESILKGQLTSGVTRVQAVVQDEQNRRRLVQKKIPCNCVVLMATNAYETWIPDAMKSRFSLYQYQQRDRVDTNGLVGQMARVIHAPTAELLKKRIQRNQMLIAYIWTLIRVGIIPDIETTVVKALLDKIFERARENHMNSTTCVRNAKRVIYLVTVLVMLEAIDKVFDLPGTLSPLHGKVFEPKHILLVSKHLVAKTEHLVMALGLEEHTYEDKIFNNVLTFIREAMLHVKPEVNEKHYQSDARVELAARIEATERRMRTLNDPDAIQECHEELEALKVEIETVRPPADATALTAWSEISGAYYDYHNAHWKLLLPDSERFNNQSYFIAAIAKRIHQGIYPKPQLEDIEAAVRKICAVQVKTANGKSTRPAMSFECTPNQSQSYRLTYNTLLIVSRDILRVLDRQSNTLFSCIQEVLNYKGAPHRTYMYGTMNADVPYVWRTMTVRGDGTEYLRIRDVNHFDPTLLQFVDAAVAGVEQSLVDQTKRIRSKPSYAASAYTFLDVDVDEWAIAKRNREVMITSAQADEFPSNNTTRFHAQLDTGEEEEKLHNYPDCFPQAVNIMRHITKMQHDAETNMVQHQLSTILKSLSIDGLDPREVELYQQSLEDDDDDLEEGEEGEGEEDDDDDLEEEEEEEKEGEGEEEEGLGVMTGEGHRNAFQMAACMPPLEMA